MNRNDPLFAAAFAASMMAGHRDAVEKGDTALAAKFALAGVKAAACVVKGVALDSDVLAIVAEPDMVNAAKVEKPEVADLIELIEKAIADKSGQVQPPLGLEVNNTPVIGDDFQYPDVS